MTGTEASRVECAFVEYGYPHEGCAEFGPADEVRCGAPATLLIRVTEQLCSDDVDDVAFCARHGAVVLAEDDPSSSCELIGGLS